MSEAKMWGTGKRKVGHREHREVGRQIAHRSYRRALRAEGRKVCRIEHLNADSFASATYWEVD
jgi:hypothetical protein